MKQGSYRVTSARPVGARERLGRADRSSARHHGQLCAGSDPPQSLTPYIMSVMRVRLHLREIRVLAVVVDTPEELRVRVESTVRRPRCPHCGFGCHRVHDTREREVRDLEVSGRRAALVWVRRRFVCGGCGQPMARGAPRVRRTADAALGAASGRGR